MLVVRTPRAAIMNLPVIRKLVAGFANAAAVQKLGEARLDLAVRPYHANGDAVLPEMPGDLDQATVGEVVRLQGEYAALAGYLEEQVALAESDSAESSVILENVKARIHLGKAGTIADKAAKVAADPGYQEALAESQKASAIARLLKAKLKSCERCIQALSRAQSAKEAEINRGLR